MLVTRMTALWTVAIVALGLALPSCKGTGQQQRPYVTGHLVPAAAEPLPTAAVPGPASVAGPLWSPQQSPPPQGGFAGGPPPTAAGLSRTTVAPGWALPQPSPPPNQVAQEFCPVTGARLGSMGDPVPVTVGGKVVYVCCAGCVNKLLGDPERYLRVGARRVAGMDDAPRYRSTAAGNGSGCCSTDVGRPDGLAASSKCRGGCCQ